MPTVASSGQQPSAATLAHRRQRGGKVIVSKAPPRLGQAPQVSVSDEDGQE